MASRDRADYLRRSADRYRPYGYYYSDLDLDVYDAAPYPYRYWRDGAYRNWTGAYRDWYGYVRTDAPLYTSTWRNWSPTKTGNLNVDLANGDAYIKTSSEARRDSIERQTRPDLEEAYLSPARLRRTRPESTLRYLSPRERVEVREYVSPARYRYESPVRTKKNLSEYKSTAAKTVNSQLSPQGHKNLVENVVDTMQDNKALEEKRVNLSLRYDLCLTELFSMMDYTKTGNLVLADLEQFCANNNIGLTSSDLTVLIDRFDRDRDGSISFSEFQDIFTPQTMEYRNTLNDRGPKSVYTFREYTGLTQEYIVDLLKSVVVVEDNFEWNKFKMTDGRILSSDELFGFLDQWKSGYITFTDFVSALTDAGVVATQKQFQTLFDQFDKNRDGRITFEEFHSPGRRSRLRW